MGVVLVQEVGIHHTNVDEEVKKTMPPLFGLLLHEYVFRLVSDKSTPPMFLLYSFTDCGHVICFLVPSLFRLLTVINCVGSVTVFIKETTLLSFHTRHSTCPLKTNTDLCSPLFKTSMLMDSVGPLAISYDWGEQYHSNRCFS